MVYAAKGYQYPFRVGPGSINSIIDYQHKSPWLALPFIFIKLFVNGNTVCQLFNLTYSGSA